MPTLIATHLTRAYGQGRTHVLAVDDVSLSIDAGEIVLIMGPSGSGKTTLLTLLGGLRRPTAGSVVLDGTDLTTLDERTLPQLRLAKLGFVFQSFNLLDALTAQENVALPLIAAGVERSAALERAAAALRKFGLGDRQHHLPAELSGGEKQRVSTARAIVNSPDVVLADEPTANLDSQKGHEVMQLLCDIACRERRAVIIVSHDQRLRDIATRVIIIEDGRLTREEPGGHGASCSMGEHAS